MVIPWKGSFDQPPYLHIYKNMIVGVRVFSSGPARKPFIFGFPLFCYFGRHSYIIWYYMGRIRKPAPVRYVRALHSLCRPGTLTDAMKIPIVTMKAHQAQVVVAIQDLRSQTFAAPKPKEPKREPIVVLELPTGKRHGTESSRRIPWEKQPGLVGLEKARWPRKSFGYGLYGANHVGY